MAAASAREGVPASPVWRDAAFVQEEIPSSLPFLHPKRASRMWQEGRRPCPVALPGGECHESAKSWDELGGGSAHPSPWSEAVIHYPPALPRWL